MEALSIALVLIFVMWLIDKHNQWKRTAKIALALVVLAVVGVAGIYGYNRYDNWREKKREKAQHDGAVKACIGRFPDKDTSAQTTCEANPDAVPGMADAAIQWDSTPDTSTLQKPKPVTRPRSRHLRVKSYADIELTTTEFGSLDCGTVKPGEIVTLLSDEGSTVKVRTSTGKVGWAAAGFFEIVD